jgi:hypothetical protein
MDHPLRINREPVLVWVMGVRTHTTIGHYEHSGAHPEASTARRRGGIFGGVS